MQRNQIAWVVLPALLMLGCGQQGPKLVNVEGTLTVNGKPIEGALIEFQPDDPNGSPSYGATNAEGHYELEFNPQRKGALIGMHTVRITTENENLRKPELLPPTYHTQSQQKYEVKDQRNNVIDFSIQL